MYVANAIPLIFIDMSVSSFLMWKTRLSEGSVARVHCHYSIAHTATSIEGYEGLFARPKSESTHSLYCTALHCTALYWTGLDWTALHCTVSCSALLYSVLLHHTTLYYTILHCTEEKIQIRWVGGTGTVGSDTSKIKNKKPKIIRENIFPHTQRQDFKKS